MHGIPIHIDLAISDLTLYRLTFGPQLDMISQESPVVQAVCLVVPAKQVMRLRDVASTSKVAALVVSMTFNKCLTCRVGKCIPLDLADVTPIPSAPTNRKLFWTELNLRSTLPVLLVY